EEIGEALAQHVAGGQAPHLLHGRAPVEEAKLRVVGEDAVAAAGEQLIGHQGAAAQLVHGNTRPRPPSHWRTSCSARVRARGPSASSRSDAEAAAARAGGNQCPTQSCTTAAFSGRSLTAVWISAAVQ